MNNIFAVSASPHLHDRTSVSYVMWQVVLALVPALMASVYFFGINALLLTIYSVIAAVLTEAIIQKFRGKPISISDGSAVVTGILLAFNLHSASPWWLVVVGSVFSIAIGKHIFGGLGNNPMNPALLGRAFLLASWPTLTTSGWPKTALNSINGISPDIIPATYTKAQSLITTATPLKVAQTLRDSSFVNTITTNVEESKIAAHTIFNQLADPSVLQTLFWGNRGGCIGEVSVIALLIGAAWLLWKHIIDWRIPVSYIGTVFVLTYIFGGIDGLFTGTFSLSLFHIMAGGLMLGAFFMATDMVTSPMTKKGRLIFGFGAGVILVVIRLVGGYPEGCSYSILIMNMAVPLIDRFTMPKPFGEVKK